MKHSEFLRTNFAFGHLAATYELDAVIFQSYMSMLYIRIDVRHLCLASTAQFATNMADAENVEEMVGTREAEAAAVATESTF